MSIVNESPTELVKKGYNYVTLPPQIIKTLTEPHALAIWCYLQSQSEGWTIRRTDIMRHFSIGRRKYDKGMHQLKAAGLVWVETTRSDKGQFDKRKIVCSNVPNYAEAEKYLIAHNEQLGKKLSEKVVNITENPSVHLRQLGETHNKDNSTSRCMSPLNKVSINNKVLLSHNINTLIELDWLPDEQTVKDIVYSTGADEGFIFTAAAKFAGFYNGKEIDNLAGRLQKWVIDELNHKKTKGK